MGVVLAFAAACCYGITHFLAGVLARASNGIAVSVYAQVGGTLVSIPLAASLFAGHPDPASWAWGVLAGAGAGWGVAFLYRGLGRGKMSVVAPVSEVCAVALPVGFGVLLLAEVLHLPAVLGLLAAPAAIWLLARSPHDTASDGAADPAAGTWDGVLGGAGIAVNYIGLAQIASGAGMWPFVLTRAVSVVVILPLAFAAGARLRQDGRTAVKAMLVGSVGTLAAALYLLSTRFGQVSISAVVASMYPAITVLLGVAVLRERITRSQGVGLGCAALAFSLCALG